MPETSGGAFQLEEDNGEPPFRNEGGSQQLLSPAVHRHPMSVFLTPQYRNLSLFRVKTAEDAQRRAAALQQLRAQRAVESFLNDGCLLRAATSSVGGGLLGLFLGAFFFTMKPVDVDSCLGLRAQLRQQYKSFVPDVASTAKSFAKIGGLYSLAECIVDKERATHDLRGAIYGGCLTGAALAIKGGPRAMAVGSLGFGAFAAAMEMLQPLIGFDA
ncbi:mitochondrial import inner membrane translocase subunit Tim17 domain-contraining protein, putative [Eimeria maxima]|uniref:Mitochondrial import inner membrane translocase subunit TIM22 n=1 Tax=Eimeria maxima TaxID=5804 RepID=U6M6P5_EIMMA|nr:mitochondrial import inner membrane translocase subunit Tim17 domain-contraining protein, putative [Eimeria maxima]CDJ58114.1 mitochondrial import inner membrane translocase subunit Tim17 domain-contraining protein, putative [Eimeria maxima]